MKELTKQRIKKPFLTLLPMFVCFGVLALVFMTETFVGLGNQEHDYEFPEMVLTIAGRCAVFIGALAACRLVKEKHGTRFREVCRIRNFDIAVPVMLTILSWSAGELLDHFGGLILSQFMIVEPNPDTALTLMNVIGAVICAPICEEMIFRYGSCELTRGAYSVPVICISSSIFFASVHFYNIQGFLNIFIGAVLMAYVYIKTRNILYLMLSHALHNAICFVPFTEMLGTEKTYINGFVQYSPLWLAINAVLLVISAAYFIRVFRKKYTENYFEINYETGLAKGANENGQAAAD